MKTLDERANEASKTIEVLKEGFDNIPKNYIEPINKKIEVLQIEKADKFELEEKADITMIMTRAEVAEVGKVDDKVNELTRKLTGHL